MINLLHVCFCLFEEMDNNISKIDPKLFEYFFYAASFIIIKVSYLNLNLKFRLRHHYYFGN